MATTTLACKQCNYENEPERVYCHNCGAKLDRSLLPPEATKRADPVVVQERVRKLVKPKRGTTGRRMRYLFLSLVIGAILAALFVIAEPPDDIPPMVDKDAAMSAPTITDDMEGLVTSGSTGRLLYTEDQVNAFLQTTIRGGKHDDSGYSPLKFERAYVHFDDGVVRITYVQSAFGLNIYATTVDVVTLQNGQVTAQPSAISLGRLKFPQKIQPYLGGMFGPLWKVLDRDRNLIARLESITFRKKTADRPASVEMVSKAGGH